MTFQISAPRWTSLVLAGVLASNATAQQPAAPAIDPKAIQKNSRVTNQEGANVLLAEARPDKIFYLTGEDVKANVVVSNSNPEACTVSVRAALEQGLGAEVGVQQQDVTLAPNTSQSLLFTWPAAVIKPFGQNLSVRLLEGDKVIATGGDCFSSADNVWRTGIAGGHPVAFTAEHVKDDAGIESAVNRFRDNYVNTFEKFFWAPDDFANMTPTAPEWFSGQARYHENLERLKHMCDYGRQVGVMPTTYGKSIGSGSAARDFIRANPETVYGFGGVMSFIPDTEELAKWDAKEDKHWSSTAWADYNMNDPAVVQHGIDEIKGSTGEFGWAGVRFDGHFQARTGKQRVGDKIVDFSADDADRQTAANQKTLKEQMLQEYPRFVFGYNYANCTLDQRFQSNLRESIELCAGGGHIMDEYAKGNADGGHPYRKWADYSTLMVRQAEQVRRLGGELFPMVAGGQVGKYQTIFTLAASAHPNFSDGPRNLYRFATRYGEFLWSPNLHNVWNPLGMVVVRPGVLWENFVREEAVDENHKRLIIHLINPPPQETATETAARERELQLRDQRRWQIRGDAAKEKKTPDFSELDKLPPVQLEPDPVSQIPVRIVPRALEGNQNGQWNATGAVLLNADDGTRADLPLDKSDPYFWQVVVPQVKYWSVLVVELEKK